MQVQNCPILFRCFIYSSTFLSNSAEFVSHVIMVTKLRISPQLVV